MSPKTNSDPCLSNPQAPYYTDRATRNLGLFMVDHMDDHK